MLAKYVYIYIINNNTSWSCALHCPLKIPTLYDWTFVFNSSFNTRMTYRRIQNFPWQIPMYSPHLIISIKDFLHSHIKYRSKIKFHHNNYSFAHLCKSKVWMDETIFKIDTFPITNRQLLIDLYLMLLPIATLQ